MVTTIESPDFRLAERRRTRRRRLHESMRADLFALEGDTERHLRTVMLNISDRGLACRIETSDADGLRVLQAVRVVFHLEDADAPFDLGARIANITSGGTAGQTVLGVEFEESDDTRSVLLRLRSLLSANA